MPYLAIVETSYVTYAVADTEAKARTLALTSAYEFLKKAQMPYKNLKDVEDNLGCNIHYLPMNGAIQEG